jgi:hypothetical protein
MNIRLVKKVFEPLQRAHLQTMYIPLGYTKR